MGKTSRKSQEKVKNPILAAAYPYRKWFVIGPIFKLTEAILELLIPTVMAYIVERGVLAGDGGYVLRMFPVMLGLAVVGYLSALVCQYTASLSSQGFGTELRNRLFSHVLSLSQRDAEVFGTPTLVNRITADVNILQQAVAMLIRLAIRAPFICIGSLIMAAILNLKLTLIILCALPLLILAVFAVTRLSVPGYRKAQGHLDNISTISRENMSGVRVVRAFSRKNAEIDRFERENAEYTAQVVKVNRIATLLSPITTLILNVAVIAVLWFSAKLIGSGELVSAKVIAFINYISYMVTALLVVANLITLFTKARASYGRVMDVFNTAEDPAAGNKPEMSGGEITENISRGDENISRGDENISRGGKNISREIPEGTPVLEFRGAALRYGNDETVPEAVCGLKFALWPGEVLGVVGMTGSGKSSLCALLTGLYAATSGEVLVNGRNVDTWNREELHKFVRIAPQQSVLFSGTVADNIRAGDESITDEMIIEALRAAQAEEFVNDKGGIGARVERRGTNFSGGQRQRLCVARAIAAKPAVLILDDSFSALDNSTARSMFNAIDAFGITTRIVVSQRAGNVRTASRILVLDDGRPVGLGTHAELLGSCPIYRDICRLSDPDGNAEGGDGK